MSIISFNHLNRRFGILALLAPIVIGLFLSGSAFSQELSPPPTNLSAQKKANGIKLTWTAPEGGADAYTILRRRPTQGENKLKRLVANTGSSATSYTDTDVNVDDGKYIYRVMALVDGVYSKWTDALKVKVGPGDFGTSAQAPPDTPVPPPPDTPVPPPPDTPCPAAARHACPAAARHACPAAARHACPAAARHACPAAARHACPAAARHAHPAAARHACPAAADQHADSADRCPADGCAADRGAAAASAEPGRPGKSAAARRQQRPAERAGREQARHRANRYTSVSEGSRSRRTDAYARLPGPVITRFDVEPGDRKLLVSWAANAGTQKVKIFYRPSGGDYQSTVFLGDNTAPVAIAGSYRISYLAGNSDYDVYVRPYMANNTAGTDSATLTRRTLMADLTVRGLRVSSSPEALGVQWNSSSDQASYQIFWIRSSVGSSGDNYGPVSRFGSVGGIEGSSHFINGLIGGERYRIEVTAFNADGAAGEPSEVFGTPDSAGGALPGRPGTPQAEQTAAEEVELTWNKPGDGAQTITMYEVRYCSGDCSLPVLYRQFDAPVDADDIPLTTITETIINLVRGETYRFAVRARSSLGLGSWSSERTITLDR